MMKLLDFLKGKQSCYIYGAGVVGYYTAKWILSNTDVEIKNFFVSDTEGNFDNYFGIKVVGIEEQEIEKECCIIVATLETLHKEIIETLTQKGCENYFLIAYSEYLSIRRAIPEISVEQLQYMIFAKQSLQQQNARLQQQNARLQQQNARLQRQMWDMSDIVVGIKKKIDVIYQNQNYYTGTGFDKGLYSAQYAALLAEDRDYWEQIKALIRDLEEPDVLEVYRIFHRLNLMHNDQEIVYTEEEKGVLQDLEENFYQKIYKIGKERIVYQNYTIPTGHFEVPVFWYRHGMEYLKHPECIRDKAVIDAGAYIGDSALIISEYMDSGEVYSFEAKKENYEYIKRTVTLNHKNSKIIPVNMALSDYTGEITLYDGDLLEGANSVMENSSLINRQAKCEVPCTTIDAFVREHHLTVGLIKADVEGAEQNLLRGAVETIKKQKPAMIISIYHSLDDFLNIKPWIESLGLGYRFKLFRPIIKGSFMAETVLICETDV